MTRRYWNVQLNDELFNAVDYVYRQSSLNGHQARVDADGNFRAVISLCDPCVHNWLDPGETLRGMLIGRWLGCDSTPIPTLTRLPFAELHGHLPAATPRVSRDEREAALRAVVSARSCGAAGDRSTRRGGRLLLAPACSARPF